MSLSIKDFQIEHKDFCNRYNEALSLYYRVCEYIEDPIRTKEEIEKYTKYIVTYTKTLSELLQEYKVLNKKELSNRTTLGGFIQFDVAN